MWSMLTCQILFLSTIISTLNVDYCAISNLFLSNCFLAIENTQEFQTHTSFKKSGRFSCHGTVDVCVFGGKGGWWERGCCTAACRLPFLHWTSLTCQTGTSRNLWLAALYSLVNNLLERRLLIRSADEQLCHHFKLDPFRAPPPAFCC